MVQVGEVFVSNELSQGHYKKFSFVQNPKIQVSPRETYHEDCLAAIGTIYHELEQASRLQFDGSSLERPDHPLWPIMNEPHGAIVSGGHQS